MKISFLEIANRITGFSTPIFGVSWNPPTLEVDIARRLLTFLEDRRVLYADYEDESLSFATESILEIRKRLTDELEHLDRSSPLAKSIADMRTVCRKYLDKVQKIDPSKVVVGIYHRNLRRTTIDAIVFFQALGELRGVFGIHIAQISVRYGIDVERQLASILPDPPDEGMENAS